MLIGGKGLARRFRRESAFSSFYDAVHVQLGCLLNKLFADRTSRNLHFAFTLLHTGANHRRRKRHWNVVDRLPDPLRANGQTGLIPWPTPRFYPGSSCFTLALPMRAF